MKLTCNEPGWNVCRNSRAFVYRQCAYANSQGSSGAEVQPGGLPAFRTKLLSLAAYFRSRVDALQSWDDVKLLSVEIDRLPPDGD